MVMDCSLGIHLSAPCCKTSRSCNVGKNASSRSSETLEECKRFSMRGTEGLKLRWLKSGAFKWGVQWILVWWRAPRSSPAPVQHLGWISCHTSIGVGRSKYMSDKWYCRFHMPGEGDVHCSRGNAIERSKMKHSSKDADRWLYHVRADVAIEGQGDDVLFNDIYGSSAWIQTAAFISPHLYACRCSCEGAQFGVSAGTVRLMSPDMMYVLSACSLSITGHPQHG